MSSLSINNNQLRDSDSRNAVFQQFYLMKYTNKKLHRLAGYSPSSNFNRDIGRFQAGSSIYNGQALWQRFVKKSSKSIPNTLKQKLLEKFSNENMSLEEFQKVFKSVFKEELAPGKYWPQQLINLVDDLLADPSEASFFLTHLVARAVWKAKPRKKFLKVQVNQFDKAMVCINQTGQYEPRDRFKNLYTVNIFNKFFGRQRKEKQQQHFLEQEILVRRILVAELEEELRIKINNITNEMRLIRAIEESDHVTFDRHSETVKSLKEHLLNLTVRVTTPKIRYGILALESKEWKPEHYQDISDLCTQQNLDVCCITEVPKKSAKKFAKKIGAAKSQPAMCEYVNKSGTRYFKPLSGNLHTMALCPSEKLVENENFTNITYEIPTYTDEQMANPQIPMVRVTGLLKSKFSGRLEAFAVDSYARKTAGKSGLKPDESYTHHSNAHDASVQDNNNNRRGHPFVEFGDTNFNLLKKKDVNKQPEIVEKYGEDCVVCNRDPTSDLKCFFLATCGTVTDDFHGFNLTFALMPVKNTFDAIDVPASMPKEFTNHRHVAVAEVHYVLVKAEAANRLTEPEIGG